ncbi:vacuolar protein sorting-associated protein 11 homolog isoform X2 [Anthonomus grandis grandis]|uniref:vacuolar protein sorting-associated protein 11 homolog isoform X2 n=1 Tax=Anthonomus grandis grandis TaxID=2921223 RepID=UPI00216634D5|nr:vacuolar protein sorting-associated protein 11 homolog isoform X2 [Anthonomus grandis grandis]
MAFLEWRKFNFFDLKSHVDGGQLSEALKECKITTTSAGNSHLVFGDALGQIHLISKSWHITTFRGYEISVDHSYQLRNSPLLVTIGHDEPGTNPLLKVWDTSKFDKNGMPFCQRVTRVLAGTRPVEVNCLTVHDNLQLMAVGFIDGSLVLYRGDVARDRSSKQKVFKELSSKVTGLAFKVSANSSWLYVSTEQEVVVYNITHKDKEIKHHLDNIGCSKKCSVLAESTQESHFMVARNNAIYCYTSDGRGPCYAVDGEKTILEWFRTYLIIISKVSRQIPHNNLNSDGSNPVSEDLITVLDIHNKFIVYQSVLSNIKSVLHEWGSFFILDNNFHMYHLDERDLQSKLSLLFKKNLYDVAIRIAKSQQYDLDGLVDIFKQYGDHLCDKGDFTGAIEQYIKTIGKLEPSCVIRKFLDSQHLEKLTMYLQALHKQGQATEDHTTLLLNCYTKLNNAMGQSDSLKEFILSKESDLNYDVDVAIKVCRHGSPAEALMLAKKHEKHDWYIKIQIEDHQKYSEVLNYIANLQFFTDADHYMKKYGQILVKHLPHESTQFLKRLCTNYKPENSPIISENMMSGNSDVILKSDPEDFIHLFLNNSERLVEFLKYLIAEGCILSPSVYSTLLEHYLHVWSTTEGTSEKNKLAQSILELLQNPDVKLDKAHALVVCNMHSFSKGILYLYEEQKLYQQILRYHIAKNDPTSVLECCTRFGHQEPTLWVQALWSCVRDSKQPSMDLLNEVLTVIAKEKLFSPQLVIDAVGTGNAEISLGHVRSYIMNEIQQEIKKTNEITELTKNYRKDTEHLKKQLEELKNGVTLLQGYKCAACHHSLELPTIHFLCNHSFHQHCFQSYSDDENECPTCQPENKNLLELLKAREYNKDLHETFHFQLDKAHDGFSVAAEYFGRGVFNKYKILSDELVEKTLGLSEKPESKAKLIIPEMREYGPGAEARIRQTEGNRKAVHIDTISEARMRVQESRYGSSVSSIASANKFAARSQEKKSYMPAKVSTSRLQTASVPSNPFEDEDDDYDSKLNPFGDEEDEELDKLNPFSPNYECDKNLNPFN